MILDRDIQLRIHTPQIRWEHDVLESSFDCTGGVEAVTDRVASPARYAHADVRQAMRADGHPSGGPSGITRVERPSANTRPIGEGNLRWSELAEHFGDRLIEDSRRAIATCKNL